MSRNAPLPALVVCGALLWMRSSELRASVKLTSVPPERSSTELSKLDQIIERLDRLEGRLAKS